MSLELELHPVEGWKNKRILVIDEYWEQRRIKNIVKTRELVEEVQNLQRQGIALGYIRMSQYPELIDACPEFWNGLVLPSRLVTEKTIVELFSTRTQAHHQNGEELELDDCASP